MGQQPLGLYKLKSPLIGTNSKFKISYLNRMIINIKNFKYSSIYSENIEWQMNEASVDRWMMPVPNGVDRLSLRLASSRYGMATQHISIVFEVLILSVGKI